MDVNSLDVIVVHEFLYLKYYVHKSDPLCIMSVFFVSVPLVVVNSTSEVVPPLTLLFFCNFGKMYGLGQEKRILEGDTLSSCCLN